MNLIVVNTFKRPFHTRLCLESICRAQRWYPWASEIAVCLRHDQETEMAQNVSRETKGVIERNFDLPISMWIEPEPMTPHTASKWMLDLAFCQSEEVDAVLYCEDDVLLSPDALFLLEWFQQTVPVMHVHKMLGVCLYHETVPEQYIPNPPDPRRLHLSNGLNTCGGTMFLRKPYLEILSPNWNCKIVEPLGFDYSAHYLMYLHKLYMAYPDLSRSMNIGWSGGSLSQKQWADHCGRSIWVQTHNAARNASFFFQQARDGQGKDALYPDPVLEQWMIPEIKHREVMEGR